MVGLLILFVGSVILISIFGLFVAKVLKGDEDEAKAKKHIFDSCSKWLRSGKYELAISKIQEIIELIPEDEAEAQRFLNCHLAEAYLGVGNKGLAIAAYLRNVDTATMDDQICKCLLKLFEDIDFYNKAVSLLEHALDTYAGRAESNSYIYILLGASYMALNCVHEAEGTLRRMKEQGFKNTNVLSEHIRLHKKNNTHYEEPKVSAVEAEHTQDHLKRFYDILEVAVGATQKEIKQAYREVCKVWHPDRFAHDPKLQSKAEQKMRDINEAYATLCKS